MIFSCLGAKTKNEEKKKITLEAKKKKSEASLSKKRAASARLLFSFLSGQPIVQLQERFRAFDSYHPPQ